MSISRFAFVKILFARKILINAQRKFKSPKDFSRSLLNYLCAENSNENPVKTKNKNPTNPQNQNQYRSHCSSLVKNEKLMFIDFEQK